MYQYRVKSSPGTETYLNILSSNEDALEVLMVTFKDGYDVEKKETMSRGLFDTCLRTGYLTYCADFAGSVKRTA